jgi:ADP-ribose pyrophosphatase YjhB (NUDIX family)
MDWAPHATVAAIVEKEGKFLFVEEMAEGRCVLNQPAGHIEEGESFIQAVCRETREETRWQVRPIHLIGIYVYRAPSNGVTYHRYSYACEAVSEDGQAVLDEGIIAAHWLTLEQLKQRQAQWRSPLVLKCLEDYLAGQTYPLDLIYEHPDV